MLRLPLLVAAALVLCGWAAAGKHEEKPFQAASLLTREQLAAMRRGEFPIVIRAGATNNSNADNTAAPLLTATPPTLDGTTSTSVAIAPTPALKVSPQDAYIVSCGPRHNLSDFLDIVPVNASAPSAPVHFDNLVDMRCTYEFFLVRNSSSSGGGLEAVASVAVPVDGGSRVPRQVHISLASRWQDMWLSWVSDTGTAPPQAQLGRQPGQYTLTFNGSSVTYAADDLCNARANITAQQLFRDPGHMYHVLATGLEHHTRYFYRVGNDQDGWSTERSFVSAPDPDQSLDAVDFIAYADQDWENAGALSTASLVSADVAEGIDDFLLHFGDLSYARGIVANWDRWGTLLDPYASRIPYMVSVGNHEYDHTAGGEKDPSGAPGQGFHPSWGNHGSDSDGECAVPVVRRFRTPENGNGIFWYSFTYGLVHVIQISSEHDFLPGSRQYAWLEADLQAAQANRDRVPWIVMTAHRMAYTTQLCEDADYEVSLHMRKAFDPLFSRYRVNAFLVGHQHSYERMCEIVNGRCQSPGTRHIVIGSAGAGLEGCGFSTKFGNFSEVHTNDWGYLRGHATPTELRLEYVMNRLGNVWDSVVIKPWK